MNNEISMSIKPEWDKIREVRIRTENFLKSQNLKDNVIDAIIMNTCELLENAVKYGSFINNTTGITASISISDSDIIVEVKSDRGKGSSPAPVKTVSGPYLFVKIKNFNTVIFLHNPEYEFRQPGNIFMIAAHALGAVYCHNK